MKDRSKVADWRKYMAEFWGTFILGFVGLGAIALPTSAFVFAPFAFGLALVAIMFVFGPVSGAHVNPAVSLACAIKRKISWIDFIFYVIAQLLGAIAAVAALFGIFKLLTNDTAFRIGQTYSDLAPNMVRGLFTALILGIVTSYIFVLAWLGIARKGENTGFIALGLGLLLTALLIAGAVVNPALNLAQAIFSGVTPIQQMWLFLVAPLIGGVLAALTACFMFREEKELTQGTTSSSK
jgi:aquaporin Z